MRTSVVRQAGRLLGAAVAAGALSAGLLATPVFAGGVNGVKIESRVEVRADVNGVSYSSKTAKGKVVTGDVNGVGVNGVVHSPKVGTFGFQTGGVNGVKAVNGV